MRQNQPGLAKTRPRSSLSTPPSKQGQPAGQPRHQIDGQPYARAPFPPLNLQGGTRGDGRGGLVSPRGAAEDGGEGFAALTGARGAAEERASPPAALTGARSRTGESRWRKAGRREGRRGGVCVCPPPRPLGGPGGSEWMKPVSVKGRARPANGGWRPPPGVGAPVVEERRYHAGGRWGRSGSCGGVGGTCSL